MVSGGKGWKPSSSALALTGFPSVTRSTIQNEQHGFWSERGITKSCGTVAANPRAELHIHLICARLRTMCTKQPLLSHQEAVRTIFKPGLHFKIKSARLGLPSNNTTPLQETPQVKDAQLALRSYVQHCGVLFLYPLAFWNLPMKYLTWNHSGHWTEGGMRQKMLPGCVVFTSEGTFPIPLNIKTPLLASRNAFVPRNNLNTEFWRNVASRTAFWSLLCPGSKYHRGDTASGLEINTWITHFYQDYYSLWSLQN